MDQEASFTFTTPLTINIVEIKGEEHMFVEGDISTNDIDLVDDIMTKECQESMQKQILERSMKLDVEHEAFKGKTHEEKEISKTKIPAGKLIDSTVKDLGKGRYSTRVKGEINRHNPNYKAIKGNLTEKYLDAFSVAFLPTDVTYEKKDDTDVRMLNDVILLNVALTGNPCNTKAQLTNIMTKSMDAVEEYKKMKELDPSVESRLVVKSGEKKENPLSYILNKIQAGKLIDKKEEKLLKITIEVADLKGAQAQLAKEFYDKVVSGVKLSYKECWVFREVIQMDYLESDMMMTESAKNKSHLTRKGKELTKFKNSNKMTEENIDPNKPEGTDAGNGEGTEGDESVEAKEAMLKSISENMKTLSGKYEAIEKDNVSLKEAVSEIAKSVAKITEALSNPIHKSPGVQVDDEEKKAKANEAKSVDPLDVCC